MKIPRAALAILLFTAAVGAQEKLTDCQRAARPVTELGTFVSRPGHLSHASRSLPVHASDPIARYIRARVAVDMSRTCDWLLLVRDERSRIVQTLRRTDFEPRGELWTTRVYNNDPKTDRTGLRLQLEGCGDDAPDVELKEHIEVTVTTRAPFYSAKDSLHPAYKPLYQSGTDGALLALGEPVGFLLSNWPEEPRWSCSGVMVAPDLFLTNWHCGGPDSPTFGEKGFWGSGILSDTLIDLSWDGDNVSAEYAVVAKVAAVPDLDYALLRVRPLSHTLAPRVARLSAAPLGNGEPVNLIHHPEAAIKQITTQCWIQSAEYRNWKKKELRTEFTHDCDTEGGSSGAPVFNQAGEVIGLQHLGYDRLPDSCTIDPAGKVNKAVRMDAILDDIRCRASAEASRMRIAPAGWLAARTAEAPCPAH